MHTVVILLRIQQQHRQHVVLPHTIHHTHTMDRIGGYVFENQFKYFIFKFNNFNFFKVSYVFFKFILMSN